VVPARDSRGGARRLLDLTVDGSWSQRFLSTPMLVGLGLYGLFAATFASFRINNDGRVYYDFMRRLLGEDVQNGYTYQFATAFLNMPFYLAAKGFEAVTGVSSAFDIPLTEVSITVASTVALVLTLYLGWRMLTQLELPAGPAVLLLALFGTPLFYYTVFQPAYKHALDALFLTLMAFLLLQATERSHPRLAIALGASLAVLFMIRFANIALVPGVLLALMLVRQWRNAALVVVSALVSVVLMFAVPAARGITLQGDNQEARVALPDFLGRNLERSDYWGICPQPEGYTLNFWQCMHAKLGLWFDGWAPLKMLFSLERGLFLWTPLTALATFGFALLVLRRPDRRPFLLGLSCASLFLVGSHIMWADFWTGGYSFSQRFLTSLFPLFLIGTAELLRRWRVAALAALSLCALFAVFVAFNHFYGYRGVSERDGLDTILNLYVTGERTPDGLVRTIGVRALERWGLR
jgi:4-amino-4-deoxy-L-arabinose transferase-like glycosyltransferase